MRWDRTKPHDPGDEQPTVGDHTRETRIVQAHVCEPLGAPAAACAVHGKAGHLAQHRAGHDDEEAVSHAPDDATEDDDDFCQSVVVFVPLSCLFPLLSLLPSFPPRSHCNAPFPNRGGKDNTTIMAIGMSHPNRMPNMPRANGIRASIICRQSLHLPLQRTWRWKTPTQQTPAASATPRK